MLGGDHSVAVGTVSGVSRHFREAGQRIGLIWLDAHADMNTPESSPTGNIHGMPLACLVGMGPPELTDLLGYRPKIEPRNTVIVGLRDVDETEKLHVRAFRRARVHHARYRRARPARRDGGGHSRSPPTARPVFTSRSTWISSIPQDAPGVGTPVRGGVTYREAHLAMEMICDSRQMVSLEVVEVNPVIDEVNRTADLAVELIMSGLGKRIL